MTQTSLTDATELPVALSVIGVAFIAFGLSKVSGDVGPVALVSVLTFLPVAVLAPCRWRDLISEHQYRREAGWLAAAGGICILVAPISPNGGTDFPRTAVILGAASVGFLVAGRAPWRRANLRTVRTWVAVAGCAIAGVLADLPTPVGWHTLAYSCFGAAAFAALTAAMAPSPDETPPHATAPEARA